MFCSSCGTGIPDSGSFCGACGVSVATMTRPPERSAAEVRRRARWPIMVVTTAVAILTVAVGFAVLGDQGGAVTSNRAPASDGTQRIGVSKLSGSPVEVSVSVVDVEDLQGDRADEVDGAAYDVSVSDEESGPLRLTLPAATDDPSSELISTWDTELSIWLPVETTTDGVDLVADVEHLSLWGSVASWVEYRVGLLTGNRARGPECGEPPAWAPDIVTVEDSNAELLACIEADDRDRLVVKVVNNRDYPVFVDFSAPWAGTPSTTVPTEIWTAFLQYTESQFGNTSLYLTGGTEAQVTFEQPTQAGTILTGYARRDISSVLAYAVFELIGIVGADIPVGGGTTLGIEAVQCYVDVVDSSQGLVEGAISGSKDQLVEAIGGMVSCIDGAVEQGISQALPGTATASKLASAKRYLLAFQVAKYANTVADLLVNDRAGSDADLVDISVFWRPASSTGFAGWDGSSSDLAFEFVRRAVAGEPVVGLVLTMQYTGPDGGVAPADNSSVVVAASRLGGIYEPPVTLTPDPAYGDSEGPGCRFEGDVHIACSVLIEDALGRRGVANVSMTNPGGSLGVDGLSHTMSGDVEASNAWIDADQTLHAVVDGNELVGDTFAGSDVLGAEVLGGRDFDGDGVLEIMISYANGSNLFLQIVRVLDSTLTVVFDEAAGGSVMWDSGVECTDSPAGTLLRAWEVFSGSDDEGWIFFDYTYRIDGLNLIDVSDSYRTVPFDGDPYDDQSTPEHKAFRRNDCRPTSTFAG